MHTLKNFNIYHAHTHVHITYWKLLFHTSFKKWCIKEKAYVKKFNKQIWLLKISNLLRKLYLKVIIVIILKFYFK